MGAIGDSEPLHITHRLDGVTSGVVVLARTKEFQKYFNNALQQQVRGPCTSSSNSSSNVAITKFYRALCSKAPPLGRLVHYVEASTFQKGSATYTKLVNETTPGAAMCELEVLSVREVELGPQP